MSSKSSFDIVVINCGNDKYFIGKVPSFNKTVGGALIREFLNYKPRGEVCYKKLNQYVDEEVMKVARATRLNMKYTKDEADQKVYDIQNKIIEKYNEDALLNDIIINPAKYKCECGYEVRLQFKDVHDEKYCLVRKLNIEEVLAGLGNQLEVPG
jgi:hypothetical protein